MATEFTSSYWSSVGTTDGARRRADELLDTLAKRTLIHRNTSGFHWDADEDVELAEFLQSMVRAALQHAVAEQRCRNDSRSPFTHDPFHQ